MITHEGIGIDRCLFMLAHSCHFRRPALHHLYGTCHKARPIPLLLRRLAAPVRRLRERRHRWWPLRSRAIACGRLRVCVVGEQTRFTRRILRPRRIILIILRLPVIITHQIFFRFLVSGAPNNPACCSSCFSCSYMQIKSAKRLTKK